MLKKTFFLEMFSCTQDSLWECSDQEPSVSASAEVLGGSQETLSEYSSEEAQDCGEEGAGQALRVQGSPWWSRR